MHLLATLSSEMVKFEELKKLRPSAWTSLLTKEQTSEELRVISIEREPVSDMPATERFLLKLAGYEEPISLLGKHTNALEATFYGNLSPYLPFVVPACHFAHISGDQSWLILEEAYADWSMGKWTPTDIELIIKQMTKLHAEFWDKRTRLEEYGIETLLSESLSESEWIIREKEFLDKSATSMQLAESGDRIASQQRDFSSSLSNHALKVLGTLDSLFYKAAQGLNALSYAGGWPGIINDDHLDAFYEIFDDPLPMLHTLRKLPVTLIHGDPAPSNWRISLFSEALLVNWKSLAIGPGIYDLVSFIEQLDLLETPDGGWEYREHWPGVEEMIIDSYILGMRQNLGTQFDSREMRLAVSAARCFYTVTIWLPRFDNWFQIDKVDKEVWLEFAEMSDEQLRELGFGQVASLKPYLKSLFERFLDAYYSL